MFRRDAEDAKKEIAEPFAAEAKFFVESRLLQRDVQLILEGVSNQNVLLATVMHPVRMNFLSFAEYSLFIVCDNGGVFGCIKSFEYLLVVLAYLVVLSHNLKNCT